MKKNPWLKPILMLSTTALLTLTSLSANDFNNDGTADIPWRNNTGKTVLWYLNTDGTHTEKVIKDVSTYWTVSDTGDFNADGIADVLWRKDTGKTAIWYMNADGTYTYKAIKDVSTQWTISDTGDFNADGITDVLWRKDTGKTAIWYMNADGTYTYKAIKDVSTRWTISATGDFNADGITDVLWRKDTGKTAIWYMNAEGTYTYKAIKDVSTQWTILDTGDFNDDGIADVIWRKDTGKTAIWYMHADGTYSYKTISTLSTDWTPHVIGDVDKDGNADILWRRGSSNYLWYMHTDGTHTYKNIGTKSIDYVVMDGANTLDIRGGKDKTSAVTIPVNKNQRLLPTYESSHEGNPQKYAYYSFTLANKSDVSITYSAPIDGGSYISIFDTNNKTIRTKWIGKGSTETVDLMTLDKGKYYFLINKDGGVIQNIDLKVSVMKDTSTQKHFAIGYLGLWGMTPDDVKNIDPLYTHVIIAFARPNVQFSDNGTDWSKVNTGIQATFGPQNQYKEAFAFLQARGVKVLLGVGGGSYSGESYDQHWKNLANEYDTSIGNSTYKKSLKNLIDYLELDGIDIDYERNGNETDGSIPNKYYDEYYKVILALKSVVGDKLLTITTSSVGAECSESMVVSNISGCTVKSPFGWKVGMERTVFQKLKDNGYSLEDTFNHVSIMAYDVYSHESGTTMFDPIKAYENYREIYIGPLAIGFNPAPEAFGDAELVITNEEAEDCPTTSMIKAYTSNRNNVHYSLERFINYLKLKDKSGIMVWSLTPADNDRNPYTHKCNHAVNKEGLNAYVNESGFLK